MSIVVKWRWWYPEGCIRAPGHDEHIVDHLSELEADDGAEIAANIVDDFLANNYHENGEFEVEILEPAIIAGVYDVKLEWSPTATATRRAASAAAA